MADKDLAGADSCPCSTTSFHSHKNRISLHLMSSIQTRMSSITSSIFTKSKFGVKSTIDGVEINSSHLQSSQNQNLRCKINDRWC